MWDVTMRRVRLCMVDNPPMFLFSYNNPTRCTNFSNLFWNETLHVSDSSSVHHQEFSLYSQPWYMSYRFADSLRAGSGWNILILLASCPKHVVFHSKINLRNWCISLVYYKKFITMNGHMNVITLRW